MITIRLLEFTPRKMKKVLRVRAFFRQGGRVDKRRNQPRRPRWQNQWVSKELGAPEPDAHPAGVFPGEEGHSYGFEGGASSGLLGPQQEGAAAAVNSGGGPVVGVQPPKVTSSVADKVAAELAYQANKQLTLKAGSSPAVVVYANKPDDKKIKGTKKVFGRKAGSGPSAAAGAAPGPSPDETMDKGPGPMDVEGSSGAGIH